MGVEVGGRRKEIRRGLKRVDRGGWGGGGLTEV